MSPVRETSGVGIKTYGEVVIGDVVDAGDQVVDVGVWHAL